MMIISLDLPHLHLWHFLLWLPLLTVRGWHWTAFVFFQQRNTSRGQKLSKSEATYWHVFFVHKYYFCLQSNCALKPDTRERGLELLNHIFPKTSEFKSGHSGTKRCYISNIRNSESRILALSSQCLYACPTIIVTFSFSERLSPIPSLFFLS